MASLVSVIIPVYNVAPYLREALDSVIHQTYPHLQILIIDDGSTDGSGTICDEYTTDSRVTVIHRENRGLSNARNTGLEKATGDYIAFLDPDDAFAPTFFEKMLDAIQDADIAVCRFTVQRTEKALNSTNLNNTTSEPGTKKGKYDREEALRCLIDGKINWNVWNRLYKSRLWNTIRFPDGHNFEDVYTMCRIFDIIQSISVIDNILYFHRIRPGSITQTVSRKNLDDKNLANSHLETYVQAHTPEIFNPEKLQKIHLSNLNRLMEYYVQQQSNNDKELREEIISAGQKIGIQNYNMRIKVAYEILRFCPGLFRIAHLLYHMFRLLKLKPVEK